MSPIIGRNFAWAEAQSFRVHHQSSYAWFSYWNVALKSSNPVIFPSTMRKEVPKGFRGEDQGSYARMSMLQDSKSFSVFLTFHQKWPFCAQYIFPDSGLSPTSLSCRLIDSSRFSNLLQHQSCYRMEMWEIIVLFHAQFLYNRRHLHANTPYICLSRVRWLYWPRMENNGRLPTLHRPRIQTGWHGERHPRNEW